MDKLLSASKKADPSKIDAADLVGAKSGDNPHLWYDPRTLPAVAAAIAEKLEKRDPKDAAEFKANLAAFQKSFAPIASEVDDIKTKNHDITVTATEPVFGYMAKALGFMMVNYDFQVAIMNNAEPSPSQVSAFEDSLKSGKVKILFFNKQVSEKTTERLRKIAEDSKVAIVGVTETEPKDLKIQAWFMGQLNEVKTALAGHAM